jgi:hypothetical protein
LSSGSPREKSYCKLSITGWTTSRLTAPVWRRRLAKGEIFRTYEDSYD